MALTSKLRSCTTLPAAMFAPEATDVDPEMINSTMAELANMAAGQMKGILQLTNSQGLPVNIRSPDFVKRSGSVSNICEHFPLRADKAKMLVSPTTQTSVAEEYVKS